MDVQLFKRYFCGWPIVSLFRCSRNATTKKLNQFQAEKFKPIVAMTEANFRMRTHTLDKYSIELMTPLKSTIDGVATNEKCLFDPKTGLKVVIMRYNHTHFVTFGCVYSGNTELNTYKRQNQVARIQKIAALKNIAGINPYLYEQAESVLKEVQSQYSDIRLVGGCLGGSIAQYLGIKYQIPTYTVNGLPIGAGIQQKIGENKLKESGNWVKHLIVKNDQFCDNPLFQFFSKILRFMGVRAPSNFGKRYIIPSKFVSFSKTHEKVMESLEHFCGGRR